MVSQHYLFKRHDGGGHSIVSQYNSLSPPTQGLYRPSSLDNLNDRMDRSTRASSQVGGTSSSDEDENNTLSPTQLGKHCTHTHTHSCISFPPHTEIM